MLSIPLVEELEMAELLLPSNRDCSADIISALTGDVPVAPVAPEFELLNISAILFV
jgi:hypothetical protein